MPDLTQGHFVFRVDSSVQIGSGHAMRCLTLANELRRCGAQVQFICRELAGNVNGILEAHGFDVMRLDESAVVTADDVLRDAAEMSQALEHLRPDWLIVDHYQIGAEWERAQRPWVRRIMVIDDMADRLHDCDLLLDQNLYDDMDERYRHLVPRHAVALVGPSFALLREEFAQARRCVHRSPSLDRILVFFGGSDPTNETTKVLRALRRLQLEDVAIDVLVGASNQNVTEIQSCIGDLPQATLLPATDRISKLMLAADLSIGAGGSTSWERCCLGLPSITIAIARNQEQLSRTLAERGYQRYLGSSAEVTESDVAAEVTQVKENFVEAVAMGLRGMSLVDGCGVGRVVSAIGAVT